MATTEIIRKVIIIGDVNTGKTSFVFRYVNGTFRPQYKQTVGVDFALKVERWTDNETIKLQLWDIAGQECFTSLTRVYYKDAHACLIMFDLTNRKTFENCLNWKKDLDSKYTLPDGSLCPCLLLANKSDLVDSRAVTQEEIENFCRENAFVGWTEISVKENIMVKESMRFLIEELMKKYVEALPEPSKRTDTLKLRDGDQKKKSKTCC